MLKYVVLINLFQSGQQISKGFGPMYTWIASRLSKRNIIINAISGKVSQTQVKVISQSNILIVAPSLRGTMVALLPGIHFGEETETRGIYTVLLYMK